MPIFEYKCKDCGKKFEYFQHTSKKEDAACPACKSKNLERALSACAVGSSNKRSSCSSGGCCCG